VDLQRDCTLTDQAERLVVGADRVKQALAADEIVAKIPIEVDAKEGFVRLWSDQTTAEERAKIVQIASGVPGVEHVEDRMR